MLWQHRLDEVEGHREDRWSVDHQGASHGLWIIISEDIKAFSGPSEKWFLENTHANTLEVKHYVDPVDALPWP